jgi:type IV pilus assembly protein PilB
MPSLRLARHFTSTGIFTPEDWAQLAAQAERDNKNVLHVLNDLVQSRRITGEQAYEAYAYDRGWSYEDLGATGEIPDEIIDLVPAPLGREHKIVPVRLDNETLVVATQDPNNQTVERLVQRESKRAVRLVYSPRDAVERAVGHYYSLQSEARKKGEVATASLASESSAAAMTVTRDVGEIVDVLDSILDGAITVGASDIHLEPEETRLRVRYSIDGVPREQPPQSLTISPRVLSLIKTRAGLDSSDLRNQDGVINHYFQNKNYDLRVAVLPAQWGQSITLRIGGEKIMDLSEIGFSPANGQIYRRALEEASGGIISTGPMGSGKTSLNLSALKEFIEQGYKIVTLEDPVEMRLPAGVTQVSINPAQDMDWTDVMPTVLRSAAKVLFLGEINKKDIAHLAIEAALTGHLMLSTLHTNDAPGAVVRLREMGIRPSVLADSLRCVVAQRLPRRLCSCKIATTPSERNIRDFRLDPSQIGGTQWFAARPGGCEVCHGIGYKGRLPIHEIMTFPREIRDMITDDVPNRILLEKVRELGMPPLSADGLFRATTGETSLDEVRRHIIID